MNRTLYFLTLFGLNIVDTVVSKSAAIAPEMMIAVGLVVLAGYLVASVYRWIDMGYHGGWGLLTLLPVVAIYGFLMPKDAKTNGIDKAGKIWGYSILGLILFFALAIFFNF